MSHIITQLIEFKIIVSFFTDFPCTWVCQPNYRSSLANYRPLYNTTTCWCPDREEHGYMYVPAFKCSTNPRIATAHRWTAADVIGRMNKPIGKPFSCSNDYLTIVYYLQNAFTTKKGCGIMLDRIKVLDSMISPLKSGRSCHQRCV